MSVYRRLKLLSDAHSISGREESICELVSELVSDYCDEVRIDKLGNIICRIGSSIPKVMLAAHMDEVGLVVKHIEENGFLRFAKVGGWFDQVLLSQRVFVHGKRRVSGVIGCKPPHVMKEDERKIPVKHEDMFIDVGARSDKEVRKLGIDVGTPITLDRELRRLSGSRVTGKAIDDRAGLVCCIGVLEKLYEENIDASVYVVGTVQEEVGLKGARTSAYHISPDVALAVDVTIAGDHPGITKKDSPIELGRGPAITVVDGSGRGLITHPKVLNWLKETAERYKIPVQMDVSEGGTTDAAAIHLTKEGVPTGAVNVPARYLHTPVEVVDLNDINNTIELLSKAILDVDEWFMAEED